MIPPKNLSTIYESLQQQNPKGCGAVKRRSIPKSLPEWSVLGFKDVNGNQLPQRSDIEARMIAPDGINGKELSFKK